MTALSRVRGVILATTGQLREETQSRRGQISGETTAGAADRSSLLLNGLFLYSMSQLYSIQ